MKYRSVRLIHPQYGEVKVIPCILNEEQYTALTEFAYEHDEIILIDWTEEREE